MSRNSLRRKARPISQIEIADKEGCARYTARILRGVTIKPSPAHIAARLESVDQRAINNAADATNYTLWEMGHPTHVFDLDLLEGGKIIIRRAFSGETLKTLDGVDRKLTPEDLVIADARKPVALAGVMGGEDTKVSEKTRNILIESAWFDPGIVRKTAQAPRHCTLTPPTVSSAGPISAQPSSPATASPSAFLNLAEVSSKALPSTLLRANLIKLR